MRKLGKAMLAVLVLAGSGGCSSSGGHAKDAALEADAVDLGLADTGAGGAPGVDAAADAPGKVDASIVDAPAVDLSGVDASLVDSASDGGLDGGSLIDKVYACGQLLTDSARLLALLRDPWTGLPYDHLPCGGPYAKTATGLNPAFGVIPQLASATVSPFSEDATRTASAVSWSLVDDVPDVGPPSLFFALKIALTLDRGGEAGVSNSFGGLVWHANADIGRYKQIRIRYRTSDAKAAWQLKLNSGTTTTVEPAVALAGSLDWKDATFSIADVFPGTDLAHLNYLTFATSIDASGAQSTLWVDQVSFVADPAHVGDCTVTCADPLPAYPDLACYEPQTGAVNVANAVAFFAVAPAAGLLADAAAKTEITKLLDSIEQFPSAKAATKANGKPYTGGTWLQDWHSPVSLMPDPRNRMGSLTDLPQLFAALMVVESTWPDLAARAAAVRARMDFSVLYDDSAGCPGVLRPGIDRCDGVNTRWSVERYGDDYLLGAFEAVATGAAPACLWGDGLAKKGCALLGPASGPWYDTGTACPGAAIPATDNGGPFLQLAALLYLTSSQIPMGRLPMAASAQNMLRVQYQYATAQMASLAGWANASDPDGCGYLACAGFSADKVTPYVSAMAASDAFPETYRMLRAFHLLGADAQLNTDSDGTSLGLRDSWNQATASAHDNYLYLDTGWSVLGLVNACQGSLLRQRFAAHAIAKAGYATLQASRSPCP